MDLRFEWHTQETGNW